MERLQQSFPMARSTPSMVSSTMAPFTSGSSNLTALAVPRSAGSLPLPRPDRLPQHNLEDRLLRGRPRLCSDRRQGRAWWRWCGETGRRGQRWRPWSRRRESACDADLQRAREKRDRAGRGERSMTFRCPRTMRKERPQPWSPAQP